MNYLVRGHDVIFNLAGQVSHIDSMQDPYTDLEINCRSQLSILEACRRNNPSVKVVFAGTRQVYGRPDSLPVIRDAPRAADRRQRHQQGGRRVLPPRLQQRVRRPRVLAAADQRLRTAAAPQAQPAGLHRLVHPSGDRGSRDTDLRRRACRSATSSTWTTPPTRSCGPGASDASNGQVFNVGRRRADRASRPRRDAHRGSPAPAATASWTGRRRRRRSTSATSRRTPRSSRARSAGAPPRTLRDGLRRGPSTSTASTSPSTCRSPRAIGVL